MENGYKYVISVDWLAELRWRERNILQSRIIGLYDNYEDALHKFVDLIRYEPECSENDIRNVVNDLKYAEEVFSDDDWYGYTFENIHDFTGRYEGPGGYKIERRRLQ